MKHRAALTVLTLLVVWPCVDACKTKECVPGREIACACPGGETGAQTCDEEGARYLPCVCAPKVNEPISLPEPAKPRKLVRCGAGACDTACCATFEPPTCTREPAKCPRTKTGEGVILECDGPEDCEKDETCCLVPGDRTIAAVCIPAGKCSGQFEHPRYKTIVSPKVVCHISPECGPDGICASAGGVPGLSTCK